MARAGVFSKRYNQPRVDKNQYPSAGGVQIRTATPEKIHCHHQRWYKLRRKKGFRFFNSGYVFF
ncbi:hypothetical protein KJR71_27475, partial [Klebsiella pneumoniae]